MCFSGIGWRRGWRHCGRGGAAVGRRAPAVVRRNFLTVLTEKGWDL